MKKIPSKVTRTTPTGKGRSPSLLALAALLTAVWAAPAEDGQGEHYRQLNLVSDIAGAAILQDTNLVNAWGIAFSATSTFWISDNGTGLATLYAVTNDALGSLHV